MQLKRYKQIKNGVAKYELGKFVAPKPWDANDVAGQFTLKDQYGSAMRGVDISSTIKAPSLDDKISSMNTKLAGMKFEQPKSGFNMNKLAGGINKAVGIAGDAVGAYSAISNAFNAPIKSGAEMNADAGTTNMSAGGATVNLQNQVDEGAQMAQLKAENQANTMAAAGSGAKLGSSVGSLLGPVGGAVGGIVGGIGGFIGGLFGGSSRKRRMEERLRRIRETTNTVNNLKVNQGVSDRMTAEYVADHENTQDDILYANNGKTATTKHNCGKSTMIKYNNGKVWSPDGYHAGPTNSKVGFGESIVNFQTGKGTLVTKGKRGVDNQNSSVKPGDDNTIFGNMMNPYSGMLFSDQAAPYTMQLERLNSIKFKNRGNQSSLSKATTKLQQQELNKAKQQTLGQLQQLAEQQQQVHMATGDGNYNCGKLPKFYYGTDDNVTARQNYKNILDNYKFELPESESITSWEDQYGGKNPISGYNVVIRPGRANLPQPEQQTLGATMPKLDLPLYDVPTSQVSGMNIPNNYQDLRNRGVNVEMPSGSSRDMQRRLKYRSNPDAAVDWTGGVSEKQSAPVGIPSIDGYREVYNKHQANLRKHRNKAYGDVDGQSADVMPNRPANSTQLNTANGVVLPEILPMFAPSDNYDRRKQLAFDGYGIEQFRRGSDPRAETVPMTKQMATENIDMFGYDEDNPYSALFTGANVGALSHAKDITAPLEKPQQVEFNGSIDPNALDNAINRATLRDKLKFRAPMDGDLDLSGNVRPSNPYEMTGVSTNAQSGQEVSSTPSGKTKDGKKKGNFFDKLSGLFASGSNNGLGDYHTLPGIASLLAGYSQYRRAESQNPKGSDIYASNPYERQALQGLSRQRLNPYRYMRDMYDAERRGAYAINNAGAMSSGQRQANRVALALGSQRNIADMIRGVDEKNIAYKQKYYDTMLSAGTQDAARRQTANQYDFDTYTKAHAAKEQMRQMGINNMLQALGDYQKNRFKRDMGRQQLSLYNRSLDANQLERLRELNEKLGGYK